MGRWTAEIKLKSRANLVNKRFDIGFKITLRTKYLFLDTRPHLQLIKRREDWLAERMCCQTSSFEPLVELLDACDFIILEHKILHLFEERGLLPMGRTKVGRLLKNIVDRLGLCNRASCTRPLGEDFVVRDFCLVIFTIGFLNNFVAERIVGNYVDDTNRYHLNSILIKMINMERIFTNLPRHLLGGEVVKVCILNDRLR